MQFMNLEGVNHRPFSIRQIAGSPASACLRAVYLVSFFLFSFFVSNVHAQTATITVSNPSTVCEGATSPVITFTGSGGNPEYTFTYTINGGGSITTPVSNNDVRTLNVPTGTPGTFTYHLIAV